MTRVRNLFNLQTVDSEIDSRQASINRIDATLADTSTIDAAREQFNEAEMSLNAARSRQRDLEYEAEKSEQHASDLEKKLYGNQIKGVKEMASAQHEIETFRQRRKQLDDEGVEVMGIVEQAENSFKAAKARLSEVEADWNKAASGFREEKERLEKELVGLRSQRENTAKMVSPADLPVYNRLRTQKQGIAVAEVLYNKMCGKCRVEMPTAKQREVRSGLQIVFCSSCGRILYAKLG